MPADLPPTAQVIADIIGRERTLRLARAVRFRGVYIPADMPARHWLRAVVGDSAAEALSREFGGIQLPLAKCSNVYRAERDRRILAMRGQGQTVKTIARTLNLNESTVRTIIYRAQKPVKGNPGFEMQHSL
jgi:DNA-binding NarL/FixJ family response regulator